MQLDLVDTGRGNCDSLGLCSGHSVIHLLLLHGLLNRLGLLSWLYLLEVGLGFRVVDSHLLSRLCDGLLLLDLLFVLLLVGIKVRCGARCLKLAC